MTSLFFAPYFQAAIDLFSEMLFGKEFIAVPDSIDCDIPIVTLYNENKNMNNILKEAIIQKTNFYQVLYFVL